MLKAPFPWFGGKSRVARVVWRAFGDVPNYVEPFAGSLAVLLARPHEPKIETVNDIDCYLANFWRAVKADPVAVATWADWPVNEADLHARHAWLVSQTEFRERMKTDPFYFDARIAGWWVWGICQWIGSGWCRVSAPASGGREDSEPPCEAAPAGVARQLPHLGDAGRGVHRPLPHLGDAGMGIRSLFEALCARLRRVRVVCGDWSRVMGYSVTWRHGVTGILLDPPYEDGAVTYSASDATSSVARDVGEWCREYGHHPKLRIALCGYEGDYDLPGWRVFEWKARGGYGSQRRDGSNKNAHRERIWFSPHCLPLDEDVQVSLFGRSA